MRMPARRSRSGTACPRMTEGRSTTSAGLGAADDHHPGRNSFTPSRDATIPECTRLGCDRRSVPWGRRCSNEGIAAVGVTAGVPTGRFARVPRCEHSRPIAGRHGRHRPRVSGWIYETRKPASRKGSGIRPRPSRFQGYADPPRTYRRRSEVLRGCFKRLVNFNRSDPTSPAPNREVYIHSQTTDNVDEAIRRKFGSATMSDSRDVSLIKPRRFGSSALC